MWRKIIFIVCVFLLNGLGVYGASQTPSIDTLSIVRPYVAQVQDLEQQLEQERHKSAQALQSLEELKRQVISDSSWENQIIEILILTFVVLILFTVVYAFFFTKKTLLKVVELYKHNSNNNSEDQLSTLEEGQKEIKNSQAILSKKLDSFLFDNSHDTLAPLTKTEAKVSASEKKKIAEKKIQHERFYAMPQSESSLIILSVSQEDSYKEYMPFILETTDDRGSVTFNNASIQNALTNFEIDVKPYADCKMSNDSPRAIQTAKEGKAKFENGNWILVEKPSLIFV